ncbi:MAG: ChbG/HpnK family deacetylase [Rhizobacter sp.]|nr:ChbG/HpnK family deacetylase [Rhizobacter sp.]
MTSGRVLAVCADDFGLAPCISAGITRLALTGRLTAVSCLTNGPGWAAGAAQLDGLPATVDVGLHLNFTEGRPLSPRLAKLWPEFPSLLVLIARAHLGALPRAALRNEIHAQLAAFNRVRGKPPAFIDGHQHVHHLPVLRGIILDMVEHVQPMPALRNTGRVLGPGAGLKRWLIEHTGGRALAAEMAQRQLAHNPALLGAYDFIDTDYRALMQGWLAALPPDGGLLFCHPADAPAAGDAPDELDAVPDAIAPARQREMAYLASAAFAQDLDAAGVRLGRVWRTD